MPISRKEGGRRHVRAATDQTYQRRDNLETKTIESVTNFIKKNPERSRGASEASSKGLYEAYLKK